MTSRERVFAALSHRSPDRTPIFEYVLQPPAADAVLGRPYTYGQRLYDAIAEIGFEAAVRKYCADIVSLARILGHDLLFIPPGPAPPKSTSDSKRPSGLYADDPAKETAERVEHAERNFPGLSDNFFIVYGLIKEEMGKAGIDLPIIAPACTHGIWTNTALMQTMVLEPEIARRHFRLATRKAILLVEKYIELDIDIIEAGGDFAGNTGPIISPSAYREFIMPEVREVSRRIHKLNKTVINASDGNLWPVIEDFLLGCEADGYIEIDIRAGMELAELKEKFGDRITFFGNLDCGNTLSFGTPETVKSHTVECLRKGLGKGGHILCSNNAITASVPLNNYLAIYEAYSEFFGVNILKN